MYETVYIWTTRETNSRDNDKHRYEASYIGDQCNFDEQAYLLCCYEMKKLYIRESLIGNKN